MNKDKPEPKLIVGSPHCNVPGAAKFACIGCKADVWLARSGQRRVRDEAADPLCMHCMLAQLEEANATGEHIQSRFRPDKRCSKTWRSSIGIEMKTATTSTNFDANRAARSVTFQI